MVFGFWSESVDCRIALCAVVRHARASFDPESPLARATIAEMFQPANTITTSITLPSSWRAPGSTGRESCAWRRLPLHTTLSAGGVVVRGASAFRGSAFARRRITNGLRNVSSPATARKPFEAYHELSTAHVVLTRLPSSDTPAFADGQPLFRAIRSRTGERPRSSRLSS